MRERCFAVLGDRVRDARVLDLFAGTGAVGLEALSRGAAAVVFVESHRPAADVIVSNIRSFELDRTQAKVTVKTAERAVADLGRRGARFDLVWADPPFERWRDGLDAITAALASGIVTDRAALCLECPAEADLTALLPRGLAIERDLTGSASRVVILRVTTVSRCAALPSD